MTFGDWISEPANWVFLISGGAGRLRRVPSGHHEERDPRRPLPGHNSGGDRRALPVALRRVRRLGAGAGLHRSGDRPLPLRDHDHPRSDGERRRARPPERRHRRRSSPPVCSPSWHGRRCPPSSSPPSPPQARWCPTDLLGDALLGRFVIPFEVVSFLLLAALIGGITVARRDLTPLEEEERRLA